MTPLLVLLFGVSPATAVGTDLLYAAITKAGGVVVHGGAATSDGTSSAGSPPAAFPVRSSTLAVLAPRRSITAALSQVVTHSLGVALILTALRDPRQASSAALGTARARGPWRERWIGPLTSWSGSCWACW